MTVEAPLEVNTNSYPVQQALVRGRGAVDGVQARLEAQGSGIIQTTDMANEVFEDTSLKVEKKPVSYAKVNVK